MPVCQPWIRCQRGRGRTRMPGYRYLTYELLDDGTIAKIMLNRPASRNAQNRGLLVELGDAMLAAEADDDVRVVILGGAGPLFSAGLMLMWACDLIVAADNVIFADVVGTRLGMCGVEYFAHPWEFGPRKAKELLLTGDCIDAGEAHRSGMVSKVFAA